MIGNGYVSPLDTTYGYYETLCTTKPGVEEPVFNQTRCHIIAESLPQCIYVYEACYQYPDEVLCKATDQVCEPIRQLFHNESYAGGRDPFDSMSVHLEFYTHTWLIYIVTRVCEVDHLCYAATLDIQRYINKPTTWRALRVPQAIFSFSIESPQVSSAFEAGNDLYESTVDQIQFTLENGVDVLVYNGNLDLACNTAGNLRWANTMRWDGQAEFTSQDLKPWFSTVDGKTRQAGSYKEVFARTENPEKNRRFTFVSVDRSGHMVSR